MAAPELIFARQSYHAYPTRVDINPSGFNGLAWFFLKHAVVIP